MQVLEVLVKRTVDAVWRMESARLVDSTPPGEWHGSTFLTLVELTFACDRVLTY